MNLFIANFGNHFKPVPLLHTFLQEIVVSNLSDEKFRHTCKYMGLTTRKVSVTGFWMECAIESGEEHILLIFAWHSVLNLDTERHAF